MELDTHIGETSDASCMLDEVLTGDTDLPVCAEMDDENWEITFFEELLWNGRKRKKRMEIKKTGSRIMRKTVMTLRKLFLS